MPYSLSDNRTFLGYMRECAEDDVPVSGEQLNRLRALAQESAGVDFPPDWFGAGTKSSICHAVDLAMVHVEYGEAVIEMTRLLREALERSEKSGGLNAEEITWREDVKSILGSPG